MSWTKYEKYIYKYFKKRYPDAEIQFDAKIKGVMSKRSRQIDILIEGNIAGFDMRIVVDCKHFNKPIDIKVVESFISFVKDVEGHKGVIITNKGYSKSAVNRVQNDPNNDIQLEVIEFTDLYRFQGFGAVIHRGPGGIVLTPPEGWIIDGTQYHRDTLATILPIGLELAEGFQGREYMYANIIVKDEQFPDFQTLIDFQEGYTKEEIEGVEVSYPDDLIERGSAKITSRRIKIPDTDFVEYTMFAEFDEFIFYCVLNTPDNKVDENIVNLAYVIDKILPMKVQGAIKNE